MRSLLRIGVCGAGAESTPIKTDGPRRIRDRVPLQWRMRNDERYKLVVLPKPVPAEIVRVVLQAFRVLIVIRLVEGRAVEGELGMLLLQFIGALLQALVLVTFRLRHGQCCQQYDRSGCALRRHWRFF